MRNSNSWTYKDKQITEPSRTYQQTTGFLDEDEEDDEQGYGSDELSFDSFQPKGKLNRVRLSNMSYANRIGTEHVTGENVGTSFGADLISEIDQKIKAHFDDVLHAVEGLSARVTQLESRMRQVENSVDDMKVSIEYNHGRTDGKLREVENIMREVQGSIKDLRDKQDIAEVQLQLAKLQMSKDDQQLRKQKSTAQTGLTQEALSFVPRTQQLLQNPVACPEQPAALSSDIPQSLHHQSPQQTPVATAPQVPNQIPNNIISFTPQLKSYSQSSMMTLESTTQQFHMPSTQQAQLPPSALYQPNQSIRPATMPQQYPVTSNQQSHPPSSVHYQPYQPTHQLPTVSQSPHPPQLHPSLSAVDFQTHRPLSHQPEEVLYLSSQSIQKSSQPPGVFPPPQQFYIGSTQQIHDQPQKRPYMELPSDYSRPPERPNINNIYPYASSFGSSSSNVKSLRPALSPSVPGDGSSSSKLPTAKILPYALPTASIVDGGSTSDGNANKAPIDDVIETVVAMGFRRDLVRATVRNLTENGQSVDLNMVLDKLMNNG